MRVGFLGAGLIATFHSKMLRGSGEDVTWAGVFDPDAERGARFASASGATAARSEEAVLDGCDAVYICTWTAEHPRLVSAAVERGRPLFVEKPLAVDLAGARQLTEEVRASGLTNQVGLVLRRSPVFNLLRALLAESGPVMAVSFRDDQFIPIQGSYGSTWRADRNRAGAGTLIEHSIHDLDLLEHVIGPVTSISARSANFHGHPDIEDAVVAGLTFAEGGLATLTSVWHDVLSRPSLRRVEVFCTDCWFAVEGDWFGPLTWQAPDGPPVVLDGQEVLDECARRGIATPNPDGDFVRAVRDGMAAWPDVGVALRAHELVGAAYQSAAAGGAPVATEATAR